jgi:hypothetical protein
VCAPALASASTPPIINTGRQRPPNCDPRIPAVQVPLQARVRIRVPGSPAPALAPAPTPAPARHPHPHPPSDVPAPKVTPDPSPPTPNEALAPELDHGDSEPRSRRGPPGTGGSSQEHPLSLTRRRPQARAPGGSSRVRSRADHVGRDRGTTPGRPSRTTPLHTRCQRAVVIEQLCSKLLSPSPPKMPAVSAVVTPVTNL